MTDGACGRANDMCTLGFFFFLLFKCNFVADAPTRECVRARCWEKGTQRKLEKDRKEKAVAQVCLGEMLVLVVQERRKETSTRLHVIYAEIIRVAQRNQKKKKEKKKRRRG